MYATSGYSDLPYSLKNGSPANIGKTSATGSSGAHNNMPPYITQVFMIKAIPTAYANITGAEIQNIASDSVTDVYSCDYINNNFTSKGNILWTNSSPTSAFASQTITLSSNDWNVYEVYCCFSVNNTEYVLGFKGLKDYGCLMGMTGLTGGVNCRRQIIYNSQTSLTFTDAYGANNAVDNSKIIPMFVIGYNGISNY